MARSLVLLLLIRPCDAFGRGVPPLASLRAPSLARTPAIEMRAAAAIALKSFSSEGIAFFNNMRVPAALIAAAAIKDAFVMQGSAPEDIKKSRAWKLLRNSYLLLQMLSFASSLSCVFISTHAITQMQVLDINMYAATLGELFVREMEYEYVGVRINFTTGLLAFVMANALRVRLALRKSRELSWCAMWFLISACASMLAYNNSHTLSYGGYVGLLGRWNELHCELILSQLRLNHPIAVAVVITFFLATASLVKVISLLIVQNADTDGDGIVTSEELATFLRGIPVRVADYARQLWEKSLSRAILARMVKSTGVLPPPPPSPPPPS